MTTALGVHASAGPGDSGSGAPAEVWAASDAPPSAAETKQLPSLGEVYAEHFSFVWRSVRRLGVAEEALEDVVQEVFIVVHRHSGRYEARASLRSWLFGIVLGVVRNHRRAARRKQRVLEPMRDGDADAASRPSQPGPYECAARAEAARMLYELLDELDDDKREVFVLAELEQLTAPEIGDALGLSPNTIYSRLRAARRDFDQAIARKKARDGWRLR